MTSRSGAPHRQETLAVVTDLLWAHAVPDDGLEHVRPRRSHDGLDVYLFVRADDRDLALRQAGSLLDRAAPAMAPHGYELPPH
ncbi:hypothetical protein [Streptomyces sp. WAC08241]|uniref:hypothetical protein n=1 Tax=Streptomyces sp. WAC08241 TaxID=2487421 RepID=UPI000F94A4E4|nr:hypothetical protein [Streptomyces sp. WAC08241]RSS33126.1 hypothetical protein EF906_32570 [Streptomyces sp. WAC08241]